MLQSDDDRWPMWNQEYDDSEAGTDDEGRAGEGPTENKKSESARKQAYTPNSSYNDAWRYASLGTELLAAVLIGTLLGWAASWLINRLTGYEATWVIAIGVLIGAAAGFLNLYRVAVELAQKEEQNKRDSSK